MHEFSLAAFFCKLRSLLYVQPHKARHVPSPLQQCPIQDFLRNEVSKLKGHSSMPLECALHDHCDFTCACTISMAVPPVRAAGGGRGGGGGGGAALYVAPAGHLPSTLHQQNSKRHFSQGA